MVTPEPRCDNCNRLTSRLYPYVRFQGRTQMICSRCVHKFARTKGRFERNWRRWAA
jgi:hypothetical protein